MYVIKAHVYYTCRIYKQTHDRYRDRYRVRSRERERDGDIFYLMAQTKPL